MWEGSWKVPGGSQQWEKLKGGEAWKKSVLLGGGWSCGTRVGGLPWPGQVSPPNTRSSLWLTVSPPPALPSGTLLSQEHA